MSKLTPQQFRYVIKVTLVAGLGGLLFGFDTAVISGAIGPLSTYFGLSAAGTGWAVSSVIIGCIIGSLISGSISHRFGRRSAFLLAAILFFMSALGSGLADSFFTYSCWRIVGGLAVGIASAVAPMYISEISPSHLRGSTVSFYQLSITLGQTGVFFVNYLIAKGMSEEWIVNWGWRWMLGSEAIPAILFASLLLLIPESPRWLILKGKEQKARDILKKFTPLDSVEKLISEIHESCFGHQQSPGKEASNNSTSLLSPSVFGIVALGVFLACAQQLTGVNVVMYYAPEILKEVVSSTESSLFQTSIMGVMYLVGNLLGIFLIDRLGRRPLLIFGGLGVSLSMAALGYVIFSQTVGYAALACLIVYVISISFSWGCVGWTLIAEIFPNRIRSKAMGVAVASVWITNFFVVQSFPMLHQNPTLQELFNGGFTFWVYAAISLISIVIVAKFVPETKGKTLEELEAITMSGKA